MSGSETNRAVESCPFCSGEVPKGAVFCGNCGRGLTPGVQENQDDPEPDTMVEQPPTTSRAEPIRTMVGIPEIPEDALRAMGVTVEKTVEPAPMVQTAGPSVSRANATLMGVPIAQTAQTAVPAQPAASVSTQQPTPVRNQFATMHGMAVQAIPKVNPQPVAAPPAETPAFAVRNQFATMHGMAVQQMPVIVPAPAAPPAPAQPVSPASARQLQNTMAGVSPLELQNAPRLPSTVQAPIEAASPPSHWNTSPPAPAMQRERDSDFNVPGLSSKRTNNRAWILFAILGVTAAGFGFYLLLHRTTTTSVAAKPAALAATVTQDSAGDLRVGWTVTGAPSGSSVRFESQTQEVAANGSVNFPLGDRGPGTYELPFELLKPGQPSEMRAVTFSIAWTARADLSHLAEQPASVHVVFRVQKGLSLKVNDRDVMLDGEGNGTVSINGIEPITESDSDSIPSALKVEVTGAQNEVATATFALHIPRTNVERLWPDQPRSTSLDRITVRGRSANARRIKVDDKDVTLQQGEFSTTVALPSPGTYRVRISAWSDRARPTLQELQVTRVAAGNEPSVAVLGTKRGTIDQIASGAAVVGNTYQLRGRLLGNVVTVGGRPAFQFQVMEPACEKVACVVWADIPEGLKITSVSELAGVMTSTRRTVTVGGQQRNDPVLTVVWLR